MPPLRRRDRGDDRGLLECRLLGWCRPGLSSQRRQAASAEPSAIAAAARAAALGEADAEIREREQTGRGLEHELGQVGRPLAAHGRERLAHLERVADRGPERLVHVGEEADDVAAGLAPECEHQLGQAAGVLDRLHEGAPSDLDVEHDRLGAGGELLRHDRRGDQRDLVDGGGDVAQAVEGEVGRDELGGLADDREADLAHLGDQLLGRQVDPEAGDRLELVERAAGVPEAAAAHLPERDAAGGDDRADRERGLVAHPARRVLVDHLAPERGAEVDRLAASDHRVGQREGLAGREPAEVDGHAEGGHLVVGNVAARVAEDEVGDLPGRQLLAVPLALDQLGGRDHGASSGFPSTFRGGVPPPSQALTVAPTSPNSPSSTTRPAALRPCT